MHKRIASLVSVCALTGCIHTARVQLDYIEVRDECRSIAEDRYDARAAREQVKDERTPEGMRNRNALLAQIFSECMRERGWTVAAPRGGKPSAPTPPPPATSAPIPEAQKNIRYMPAETVMPAQRRPINPDFYR
jgi:hypothetical protein